MTSKCCNTDTFRVKNKLLNLEYDICNKCGKPWVVTIEEWTPIKGFEDRYEVSTTGIIRSLTRLTDEFTGRRRVLPQRELKYTDTAKGYYNVKLSYTYGVSSPQVHRVVAENWIPNPHNYKYVTHISGNKHDNSYLNLKWTDHAERKEDSRSIYKRI